MRLRMHLLTSILLLAAGRLGDAAEQQTTAKVDPQHAARMKAGVTLFKKHVRSILQTRCLKCHGGKSVKADFDLSSRKALADSGYLDKTATDSQLFALITHSDEPHMPYKQPRLPAQEIEHIRQWIDFGAPYDKPLSASVTAAGAMIVTADDRDFWSFRRLQQVPVPAVQHMETCETDIDRFVVAALEQRNLHLSAVAPARVLIRRAYYDLLGLPPTPDQVRKFEEDKGQDGYERLIDTLLDSPHYGERWARHWMDVARFAESHGYEQDYDRKHAYHYRDFLIEALNNDLPYDTFVRWQLAGDELAPEHPLALKATGFLGAGVFPTQLTEAEFESARYDELDDMTATTGVAFLGLSIGCARCHDHKYDPLPSRDYYGLAANFTATIRSEVDVDLAPQKNKQRRADYTAQLARQRSRLEKYMSSELVTAFRSWLKDQGGEPQQLTLSRWSVLDVDSVTSTSGTQFKRQPDGSWLATGQVAVKEVITVVGNVDRSDWRALRLEALAHDSLPKRGPGRAANGNFALGNVQILVTGPKSKKPRDIKLSGARATHQQNSGSLSVAASIDDDPISGWAVDAGGIGHDQAAVFDFHQPVDTPGPVQFTIKLTLQHPNARHTLGRFRLSVSNRAAPKPEVGSQGLDPAVLAAIKRLHTAGADEQSEAWKIALKWFATTQPAFTTLTAEITRLEQTGPTVEMTKVQVSSEGFPHVSHHADGRGYPHFYPQTHFLQRGDVHQKGDVMTPQYLQVLTAAGTPAAHWQVAREGWTRTRLHRAALANWMTDPDRGAGHLLARVIVNRLWQHHFGRGLVSTPNDFGYQGEEPTHPQLLDWLAQDLIRHKWSLKHLHKQIMLSRVYRQNSQGHAAGAQGDPENTLWWRREPRRLEAEAIRDAMLSVSGQLDSQMYGPGTLDANMRRRSIYFFVKRSRLIPMMMLFDWPEHLVSIGRRSVTTTAPQALLFMNNAQGSTYVQGLAKRLTDMDDAAAIDRAYWLAFSRGPLPRETELALKFLQQQTVVHTQHAKDKQAEAQQLAMWDLCRTLLSMNEFLYID